jgi:CDP-glucose 4,6-dehydratase
LLYLDSAKARSKLGWQPVWNLDVTLEKTAEWYRAWLLDKAIISRRQLADYLESAADAGIEWAKP